VHTSDRELPSQVEMTCHPLAIVGNRPK